MFGRELFEQASRSQLAVETTPEGVIQYLNDEYYDIENIATIIDVVIAVAKGSKYTKGARSSSAQKLNKLGVKILSSLKIDSADLILKFNKNQLSPYLHVFADAKLSVENEFILFDDNGYAVQEKDKLGIVTHVVKFIAGAASNATFRLRIRNYERAVHKNCVSMKGLV